MSVRTNVKGRTAVITGAASGIGRAMAVLLSQHGSPVAICDWNEEGLAETEAMLSGHVLARKLDVSDRGAQMRFAAEVIEWAPEPIALVLNNAGVTVSQLFSGSVAEDDEWVMNVNYWGVVHGTRAFLPTLEAQNSGSIVNVSSIFGLAGWPSQSGYCASKAAVKGFTESLREELHASGVGIHVVHPGGIDTNIVSNARFHNDDKGSTDRTKLERDFKRVAFTSPEKAAETILAGVEKGRSRILIGADARLWDLSVRFSPKHYFRTIRFGERFLRQG